MNINYYEFIVMTFLFVVGFIVGVAMTLKNSYEKGKHDTSLVVSFSASLLCGFFAIVGGGIISFFLPKPPSPTMMATGGIIMACIASLFTTEEMKDFFNKIIKRLIAITFNLK